MKGPLEYACEQLFMALLSLDPEIAALSPPISIIHYDDNVAGLNTLNTTIVVEAVQGAQDLGGFQPFNVELVMEWRSTAVVGVPDPIGSVIANAMRNAAYTGQIGSVSTDITDLFAGVIVEPEASGDRSNDKTSRHRLYKVPLLAKLLTAPMGSGGTLDITEEGTINVSAVPRVQVTTVEDGTLLDLSVPDEGSVDNDFAFINADPTASTLILCNLGTPNVTLFPSTNGHLRTLTVTVTDPDTGNHDVSLTETFA